MLNVFFAVYGFVTNTHLLCALAGALVVHLMHISAAVAGWGKAAQISEAAAAAASIVKTALTPTPPLPTTVAQMKAANMTATTPALTVATPAVKQGIVSKIEGLFGVGTASSTLPATILADIGKLLAGIEAHVIAAVEAALAAHLATPAPAPVAPAPAPVVAPVAAPAPAPTAKI